MGVRPQKDPQFKLLKGSPRRYMDMKTGEVISRSEFERRVAAKTAKADATEAPVAATMAPPKAAVAPGKALATKAGARTAKGENGAGTTPEPAKDVPIAKVVPPPPPPVQGFLGAVQTVADKAGEAAQALDEGLVDAVPSAVPFLALAVAGICNALLPEKAKFLALPPTDLQTILLPLGRIAARHSPVKVNPLTEDGKDGIALLSGLGVCGATIWDQYQEQKRKELEFLELVRKQQLERGHISSAATAPHQHGAQNSAGFAQAQGYADGERHTANGARAGEADRPPAPQDRLDPDAAIAHLYAKHSAMRAGRQYH